MWQNSTGIYQLADGTWGYRVTYIRDGKRFDKRFSKDIDGQPLKTGPFFMPCPKTISYQL